MEIDWVVFGGSPRGANAAALYLLDKEISRSHQRYALFGCGRHDSALIHTLRLDDHAFVNLCRNLSALVDFNGDYEKAGWEQHFCRIMADAGQIFLSGKVDIKQLNELFVERRTADPGLWESNDQPLLPYFVSTEDLHAVTDPKRCSVVACRLRHPITIAADEYSSWGGIFIKGSTTKG